MPAGQSRERKRRTGYMNFLIRITPDCDCFPFSDTPIVPDIGILASRDPVAIDAASFDLVNRQQGFLGFPAHGPSPQRGRQIYRGSRTDRRVSPDQVCGRDGSGKRGLRADPNLSFFLMLKTDLKIRFVPETLKILLL